MRAFDETQPTRTGSLTATVVAALALVFGLGACGAGVIERSKAAPGTRLIVRTQAADSPVAAKVEVTCEGPITTTANATIASSFVQRFDTVAAPGHDWAGTLDVGPGSTCTAIDTPAAPATLQTVTGGQPVDDGGRLTGVRTTVDGGATVTVSLLAGTAA